MFFVFANVLCRDHGYIEGYGTEDRWENLQDSLSVPFDLIPMLLYVANWSKGERWSYKSTMYIVGIWINEIIIITVVIYTHMHINNFW